jgi:4-hydroxy-3-polyprenylbenzoate decarboxylase
LETDTSIDYVNGLADHVHDFDNLGASITSGSFETLGMAVAPCSIKTLSGIANSFNVNLLIRAADVTLKEGRKLLLMVRETPLHQGHLRLMQQAAAMGAVIMPPVPAFYKRPKTIEDILNHTVGRMLGHFSVDAKIFERWSEKDGNLARQLFSEG